MESFGRPASLELHDYFSDEVSEADVTAVIGIRVRGYPMKGGAYAQSCVQTTPPRCLSWASSQLHDSTQLLRRGACLPGVLNETADTFSRLSTPGSEGKTFPVELANASADTLLRVSMLGTAYRHRTGARMERLREDCGCKSWAADLACFSLVGPRLGL